jgi:hypothetical protein
MKERKEGAICIQNEPRLILKKDNVQVILEQGPESLLAIYKLGTLTHDRLYLLGEKLMRLCQSSADGVNTMALRLPLRGIYGHYAGYVPEALAKK